MRYGVGALAVAVLVGERRRSAQRVREVRGDTPQSPICGQRMAVMRPDTFNARNLVVETDIGVEKRSSLCGMQGAGDGDERYDREIGNGHPDR